MPDLGRLEILVNSSSGEATDSLLGEYREVLRRVARRESAKEVAALPGESPHPAADLRACHPAQNRAIWLAATQAAANDVREALAAGETAALLDPGITTFSAFAARIVRESGRRVHPISAL